MKKLTFAASLAAACAAHAGELLGAKFLITTVRTGDTEIFAVTPETGDALNLSRSPASGDRYPCWSPDGKRVAFTSNRDAGHYKISTRWTPTAETCASSRTARRFPPCRGWVGERIVFGLHGERPEMASIREDGTDLKILGPGHDPCLSPDGARIAFTGECAGGVAVWTMNTDGTERRQLTEANPWGAIFPSWSPDGKQIVFAHKIGAALELFIVGADGAGLRQLTHLEKSRRRLRGHRMESGFPSGSPTSAIGRKKSASKKSMPSARRTSVPCGSSARTAATRTSSSACASNARWMAAARLGGIEADSFSTSKGTMRGLEMA